MHSLLQPSSRPAYQFADDRRSIVITKPDLPSPWINFLANVRHVTGTAAWMDVAATQYLLGIRPELDGLRLVPVLPSDYYFYPA